MATGTYFLLISRIMLVSVTCFSGAVEGGDSSKEAEDLKEDLNLKPHPLGGYFRENYRWDSKAITADPILDQVRDLGSSAYFLLEEDDFYPWTKVKNHEVSYWQAGGPMYVHMIDPCGKLTTTELCNKLEDSDCEYQLTKPPCNWIALEPKSRSGFALIATAAWPGIDIKDREVGKEDELLKKFPDHKSVIKRLTRS